MKKESEIAVSSGQKREMFAKLYLGDISQERIKPSTVKNIPIKDYFATNNQAIVICCDAFCCVLDCDRPRTDPEELVSQGERMKQWAPELVLRKEPFGGLVWNRKTGHVWEIGEKETKVCFELAKGKTLQEVGEEYGISEADLFSLLSDVSRQF